MVEMPHLIFSQLCLKCLIMPFNLIQTAITIVFLLQIKGPNYGLSKCC